MPFVGHFIEAQCTLDAMLSIQTANAGMSSYTAIVEKCASATDTEYIVNGAGGALWYRYDQEAADVLEEERGIVAEIFERTWGFVGMTLTANDLYFEFVNNEGDMFYSYRRAHW